MTAKRPTPRSLVGRFVRLDPMRPADLSELYRAIGHPSVFDGGYGGGPLGYRDTEAGFLEWAETYYAWGVNNVYAIRVVGGSLDGVLVGTTTLGDFDEELERAHIGWTAYDPRVWGTAVNPEAKLLLLNEAFGAGFGRVKILADEINARSRAAIAKLGATFEGIIRRDRQRADGSWRNSAVFSIIVDDWPAVQARLEARVGGFGDTPVSYRQTDAAASTPPKA